MILIDGASFTRANDIFNFPEFFLKNLAIYFIYSRTLPISERKPLIFAVD